MSINEFPTERGSAIAFAQAAGSDTLQFMASDLERLIQQANAAKELPLLVYLLQVALNEAQIRLEG